METSKKTEWTVSKKEWQEAAVTDHLNCCLCGTTLRMNHKVDHVRGVALEEANCPACGVKNRESEHSLQ